MRLFLSYARVDKPYCQQIATTLDIHDVWYDQRLYAGQHWWGEILRRLDWCEGFVYLISPESLDSEYCRREYEIAKTLNRPIFPVVIRPNTPLPNDLVHLQYVDFGRGITADTTKMLLDSIYVAERESRPNRPIEAIPAEEVKQPVVNMASVIRNVAIAMEEGRYDQAVFYIKQAKNNGFESSYIKLDEILKEAESALTQQSYLLVAEREYRQIAELIQYRRTRNLGLEAFSGFRRTYPNFDPDGLSIQYSQDLARIDGLQPVDAPRPSNPPRTDSEIDDYPPSNKGSNGNGNGAGNSYNEGGSRNGNTSSNGNGNAPIIRSSSPFAFPSNNTSDSPKPSSNGNGRAPTLIQSAPNAPAAPPLVRLPLFEWCAVTEGTIRVQQTEPDGQVIEKLVMVAPFRISKYPITNGQYQVFLNDPTGYANLAWWGYSDYASHWRMNNASPKASRFKGDDRPREMVNWYDSMAFCYWLSAHIGRKIMLPTAVQWQRAFQGDDERVYPWGNTFSTDRCNTVEAGLKCTTIVTRYENGVSPFGVYDMAGNLWEWCLDSAHEQGRKPNIKSSEKRIVRGGSFVSPYVRSQANFVYELDPISFHNSIGFRVVDITE